MMSGQHRPDREMAVHGQQPAPTVMDVVWTRPREWRVHMLGTQPYWVEEEAELVQGADRVAQLSFDQVVDATERARYEAALRLQWRLVAD